MIICIAEKNLLWRTFSKNYQKCTFRREKIFSLGKQNIFGDLNDSNYIYNAMQDHQAIL